MNLYTYLLLIHCIGILHLIGLNLSIFERDTIAYLLKVVSGDVLVKIDMVNLLLQELGMSELAGHVTIVGEEQYSCSVTVETSHRIDTLRTGSLHKVHHCLTLLWIIAGGYIILGFIEQHIDLFLKDNGLVVETHLVGA